MNARTFIDANVLVYAFTATETEKQAIALKYLSNCLPVVSAQVIKEFSNVALKKYSTDLETLKETVSDILEVTEIIDEDIGLIFIAYDIHAKYSYSFYDSLIIASALKAKCTVLLSEDMADGQGIDYMHSVLKIVNPFK